MAERQGDRRPAWASGRATADRGAEQAQIALGRARRLPVVAMTTRIGPAHAQKV
jgi:hypothetical protein